MMDEEALRTECEAVADEVLTDSVIDRVSRLLAFAKRQRAAGLREMCDDLGVRLAVENGSTDDDVYRSIEWAKARAKALEEGATVLQLKDGSRIELVGSEDDDPLEGSGSGLAWHDTHHEEGA